MGDDAGGRGGAEHLLRLALELRLGHPDRHHAGQALGDVVLGDGVVAVFQQAGLTQQLVDRTDEAALETGQVGAALGRGDDVDERAHGGLVALAPAHGHVDAQLALDLGGRHVALVVEDGHGLVEVTEPLQPQHVADGLVAGQELGELGDAAVEVELVLDALLVPAVDDRQGQAGHQERRLPQAHVDLVERDLGVGQEDLLVGPEAHACAGGVGRRLGADAQAGLLLELGRGPLAVEDPGHAAAEADLVDHAVAVDLDVDPGRQGVDHGGAHAVQTAGGAVGAAAELAARVELRVDELDARQTGLRLDVDGNAPPVVAHLDGPVGVELDLDPVAVPRERLVDAVVHDLPEAVHEPATVGGPDVHAGSLANGLEALKHRQVTSRVTRLH